MSSRTQSCGWWLTLLLRRIVTFQVDGTHNWRCVEWQSGSCTSGASQLALAVACQQVITIVTLSERLAIVNASDNSRDRCACRMHDSGYRQWWGIARAKKRRWRIYKVRYWDWYRRDRLTVPTYRRMQKCVVALSCMFIQGKLHLDWAKTFPEKAGINSFLRLFSYSRLFYFPKATFLHEVNNIFLDVF